MGRVHFSDRQWDGSSPARARRGHRYDGYSRAERVWLCRLCTAWHDEKPKECIAPDCTAGKKDMLFFGSRGEAQRFIKLMTDQSYGLVRGLEHHPRYDLAVPTPSGAFAVIGVYEADSYYQERTDLAQAGGGDLIEAAGAGPAWRDVVEDFKPVDPRALDRSFEWKRKHFEAQYGIPIRIMTS